MVEFAGYMLPVQYAAGIMSEHRQTRASAGLFDVSHMGQIEVSGDGSHKLLERLLPIDLDAMSIGQQQYCLMLNEAGGVIDDLIVSKLGTKHFLLVVNAACKTHDFDWIQQHNNADCALTMRTTQSLIALQGPKAIDVMAHYLPEISALPFMHIVDCQISGADCRVSRSGYTGEDGVEISLPNDAADAFARQLLRHAEVELAGLGARDSLRLEAGLCLYGHELSQEISLLEAGLLWTVGKQRRQDGSKAGGFIGAEALFEEQTLGVKRRRIGLDISGRAPVREGSELLNERGEPCGIVTSGGFGPTVEQPVAMALVDAKYAAPGTQLLAQVRKRQLPVSSRTLPFTPHRYFRA